MSCCRVLLRSSAGDSCFLSDRLCSALHKRTWRVFSAILLNDKSSSSFRRRGSPEVWAPSSWARPFYTSSSSEGRYIAAESTDSRASLFTNLDGEKKWENYLVVNFYVLVNIDDPQGEVARHLAFMQNKDIQGRILISSQGINAQYSGPREDVIAYANWVREDPRYASLYVQVSPSFDGHAFPRLKLRYKPSLVQVEGGTASLPITDPCSRAIPLSPGQWKDKITQNAICVEDSADSACQTMKRTVLVLDVRNGYEWDIGHFKGAQRPPVDCFKSTEFGLQYTEDKESDPLANVDKENTDVLMYCTGGIRCDIYSAILRQKGFKNLYSLQGGVARYLIEESGENWLGNLFVFDSRLSVPPAAYKQSLDILEDGMQSMTNLAEAELPEQLEFCRCNLCQGSLSQMRHRNCANLDCNRLFLCCDRCVQEVMGCCSKLCTVAPRKRPFFSSPQQYQRWHNYRDGCLSPPPDGYLGERANRRLRDLQQEQLEKTNFTPTESLDGVNA
ncbi:hypothetical protein GOP47_0022933 [Adiantum capillus-veneris]|uniref:Rhodanese domain-containing protein n=1 Tax=Adiantum capillus-veneris TaxID=13818 RepID=A0A9D4Z5T4_ADICA|nr:hypothetical protein GOP47_0022933 [Adiantum capillus-veneris]